MAKMAKVLLAPLSPSRKFSADALDDDKFCFVLRKVMMILKLIGSYYNTTKTIC